MPEDWKLDREFIQNTLSMDYFRRLPFEVQQLLYMRFRSIVKDVRSVYPSARITSGYRCPLYNFRINSRSLGFHCYCLAIDVGLESDLSDFAINGYRCVRESNHWHIEYVK